MQFNTLCECYQPNHLPDGQCQFGVRNSKIVEQIRQHNCDIVSLNECNPSSFYRAEFSKDYHIAFVGKSDWKRLKPRKDAAANPALPPVIPLSHAEMVANENDTDDGQMIMVKKQSSIEVIRFDHLVCFDGNDEVRPARQNAILAWLHHLPSGKEFFVISMHMKANGYNAQEDKTLHYDGTRIRHLKQVLTQIQQIRMQRSGLGNGGNTTPPILFAGDFNADLRGETMRFLLEGRAIADNHLHFLSETGKIEFASVTHEAIAAQIADEKRRLRATNAKEEMEGRLVTEDDFFTILDSSYNPQSGWHSVLDYILYEKGRFAVTSYLCVPWRKRLPEKEPGWDGKLKPADPTLKQNDRRFTSELGYGQDAIPHTGSDHIPIAAEFLLL